MNALLLRFSVPFLRSSTGRRARSRGVRASAKSFCRFAREDRSLRLGVWTVWSFEIDQASDRARAPTAKIHFQNDIESVGPGRQTKTPPPSFFIFFIFLLFLFYFLFKVIASYIISTYSRPVLSNLSRMSCPHIAISSTARISVKDFCIDDDDMFFAHGEEIKHMS